MSMSSTELAFLAKYKFGAKWAEKLARELGTSQVVVKGLASATWPIKERLEMELRRVLG